MRIGLISDTHGLLRPEVLEFLRGSDHIVHGGDVCDGGVLETLRTIAPVTAVRGNNDRARWAAGITETEVVEVGGVALYLLHDLHELDVEPRAAGFAAVISGHSHQPRIDEREGVLYLNPGSAGPRRFRLPISAGELAVEGGRVSARLVDFGERRSR